MALADSTARKQVEEPRPLYRSAPHNIEAEQALLGAILVNNEAFYRVSDFLEPAHFFEPIHQKSISFHVTSYGPASWRRLLH
jgi:replicative DNA helicase